MIVTRGGQCQLRHISETGLQSPWYGIVQDHRYLPVRLATQKPEPTMVIMARNSRYDDITAASLKSMFFIVLFGRFELILNTGFSVLQRLIPCTRRLFEVASRARHAGEYYGDEVRCQRGNTSELVLRCSILYQGRGFSSLTPTLSRF